MTSLSTVSLAVERTLTDAAKAAPDIGVSELMFYLLVRTAADNRIEQLKETDGCS